MEEEQEITFKTRRNNASEKIFNVSLELCFAIQDRKLHKNEKYTLISVSILNILDYT